jgi:hypothetical protein
MFFDVEWTETVRKHGKVEAKNSDEAYELALNGDVDSDYDELGEFDSDSLVITQADQL